MTPSLSQTVIEQFNSFAQSGIISPKILVLSAVPETPSKSQHQIVWIVKVVQDLVAYFDKRGKLSRRQLKTLLDERAASGEGDDAPRRKGGRKSA